MTFTYTRATSQAAAIAEVSADPRAAFLAGGTTQVDLALKDGVIDPRRLVDISRLPMAGITVDGDALRVGATTTMAEMAADERVGRLLPFVREALLLGASPQLRNMATIGGNLLQRTRCRYFRDLAEARCNKRTPGTGCAAVEGVARMHAILGASPSCIALHASDLAVPLTALGSIVHLRSGGGPRTVPLTEFYRLPGEAPDRENVLWHGELITDVEIPLPPARARTTYIKVRDRASYEFALTSAAVATVVDAGFVVSARIALGGVGTIPWRAWEAEDVLRDAPVSDESFRAAANAAIHRPFTVPGTEFKVELAKRTLVRALRITTGLVAEPTS
ncbi:FAD binding domain-containing protein [Dactylosporangium darangshiense]|uniref:Xanthine dehydrogenase family protein subunit M n=1 Tax=Dactylosporangium darangshiense TaxID=579108 RepID=A0ABP8DII2_9ACTN